MAERSWSVYLSGEIHSDWRERIEAGAREAGLPRQTMVAIFALEVRR